MCMCGCSKTKLSSGSGKCCGLTFTGDVIWDGGDQKCPFDDTFNLEDDDDANVIITTLYNKLCQMQTPVIYSSASTIEDFPEDYAAVSNIRCTAPATGNYKVTGLINYRHALIDSIPIQNCAGEIALIKELATGGSSTILLPNGLVKSLASELNDATPFDNNLVSAIIHALSLNEGDKMYLAFRSLNQDARYTSIGGQLMLERIPSFTIETP